MSANTKIEWADASVNHWVGCTAISPGCDHCYAKRIAAPFWGQQWGPGVPRQPFSGAADSLKALDRKAKRLGRPLRVFHNSVSDLFDNEVPETWRVDAFTAIEETPNLIHLLVTKRIGNVPAMLPWSACSEPWPNVWIGATVVNQEEADRDIPKLLDVPAAKRFLSMEPLLGPVDIRFAFADSGVLCCPACGFRTNRASHGPCPNDGAVLRSDIGIDWVIVGGESGPGARPMHPDWARSLRDQCQAAGVPFFFKQHGEWNEIKGGYQLSPDDAEAEGYNERTDCVITIGGQIFKHPRDLPDDMPARWMERIGKKAACRLLDGRTWDEVPA